MLVCALMVMVPMRRRMLLNGFPPFTIVQLHPIILSILNFTGVLQRLGEQISKVVVVGGIFEPEVSDVTQVLIDLIWESVAKILNSSGLLLLTDLLVLLLVSSSLQPLPGKATTEEVHENVTESLQIVSSGLLTTQMGIDGHVTSGTG